MSKKKRTDFYGEVFTPPVLIRELLDALPPRVWSNPEGRWLDPCAGQGNFLDEILPRLMDGLRDHFAHRGGEAACRRHILERMVMQVEINPSNVRILRKKYGARARIVSKDFLALDAAAVVEQEGGGGAARPLGSPLHPTPTAGYFDVIVANPPYQAPKTATYTGSAGNRALWEAFVQHALTFSTPTTGVLAFVTPANWRRPEHPLWPLLRDRLLYLHIYGKAAGMDHFHVQTRFDLYVFSSTPRGANAPAPVVVDEHGETHDRTLHPSKWPFLPNFNYRSIQPLLASGPDQGIPVVHDSSTYDARKLTRRPTKVHPYPVIHTLTQKGMGIRYASHRDPRHFGVPKVVFNVNEKQYPVNDWRGKYGMSQLSFGVPIRSRAEGERWLSCAQQPEFDELIRATKWGSFQTDHRLFSHLRRDTCRRLLRPHSAAAARTKKRRPA